MTNHIQPNIISRKEALKLTARYFEAETSEAEERLLKSFLCTPESNDPAFEEVRALMGLGAYGRRVLQGGRASRTATPHKRPTTLLKWAAAIAIVLLTGVSAGTFAYQHNNQCVAYIDGRKITDSRQVMQAMRTSMHNVGAPTGTPTVESQLKDMFDTMD